MSLIEADARFIRAALREARKALGQTSPNPAVGTVLVVRNRIVSRGHHSRAGASHAEVECLRSFGKPIPKDAALYVTLEPCSTTGRTPACTTEIIKAGVKTVIIGAVDVNPCHSGRGIDILRRAGIEARVGVLADECAELNEAFNKWIVTGRPFVIAKCGMSLDGRLTRPATESRWITSDAARRHAHALRADVDAILVGAETVRRDNPRLTVRGFHRAKQQPLRIILTRSGNLPSKARVFTDHFVEKTMVYRQKSLGSVLSDLGRKNVISVLIEGGGDVLGQALDEEAIDKVQIYLGPILTGGPVIAFPGPGRGATHEAARLERVRYEQIGQNLCITGYPKYRAIASTE